MRPRQRTSLALHVSERIDDAAEQYGLGELYGRQRDIRKSKHPAQTNLRAEQTEDPRIKAKNHHGPLCAASPLRDKRGKHLSPEKARKKEGARQRAPERVTV